MDRDLAPLIKDHGYRYLVESGVDGVEAALELDLDQIFAIESHHKKALDVALRFAANHKATIIHARLEKGLSEALLDMRPDLPAIFRLDAAFIESAKSLLAGRRDISRDLFLTGED